MTDAVVTESLTKVFRGGRRAVDSVTLRIPKGVVYGLVGPNGAGKTTLMRCMLGLASITSGRVELLGVADIPTALARTGALVEEPKFHGFLTGTENLEIIAQLRGIAASPAIPEALDRVGLSARAGERVRQYSLGMRQRLAIARCLLANPDLLVLDEPANGLDPDGIREMRELVQSLAQDGRTVMVSSHQLGDLAEFPQDIVDG